MSTMDSPLNKQLNIAAQEQTDELNRRIDQLWIGLWVLTSLVLVSTFIIRRLTGNPISVPAIIIQIALNGLVLFNLIAIKTRYAPMAKGLFVFTIHLTVPLVLILFGGTRGFGDVALIMAILLAMLHGWRRWMFLTYGGMGAALLLVLYRDSIGRPIEPLLAQLDYSTQFSSIKFLATMSIMLLVIWYIRTFYNGLLLTYRNFADEQARLNDKLKENEFALAQSNKALTRSRHKIVTAREAERQRLRRDLHDGLGPTLAAQIFRIGIAKRKLPQDPDQTAQILTDVESNIDETLSDIRKLVYGLRPPRLDQLGLIGAMNDFAGQHQEQIRINLDLPSDVPQISAAVEVALYFIFQTALDNVVKHAQATQCNIRLNLTNSGRQALYRR